MLSLTKSAVTRRAWARVTVCGLALLSTAAMASLKEKPPKGVDLTGTWQLDPYRSDDPTAVIDQARADMPEQSSAGRGGARAVWGLIRR